MTPSPPLYPQLKDDPVTNAVSPAPAVPAVSAPAVSALSASGLSHALLWALAGLLALLIGVRLFGLAPQAHAKGAETTETVATAGDFTLLTINADTDDVLLVLDGRSETLSAYRVKNKSAFELVETSDLRAIFTSARRMGSGK